MNLLKNRKYLIKREAHYHRLIVCASVIVLNNLMKITHDNGFERNGVRVLSRCVPMDHG